jgi:cytochrome c-type biogenesis protein CcmH
MRRLRTGVLLLALALPMTTTALATSATATATAATRVSFTDIETEVMCVVCHEPLAVAQSPEAFQERDYIRGLILQGKSKRTIESDLVQQYGPAVLAKPPAHGFNLLVWVVPPVAVILGVITLAITIPRWRRRTRQADAANPAAGTVALSDTDARRLDEDLARDF